MREIKYMFPNYNKNTPGLTEFHQKLLLENCNKIENFKSQQKRADKVKEFLASQVESLGPDEKIGVVTHFVTIANLTAKGLDPEHRLGLKDYHPAENCENIPLNIS